MNQIIFFLFFLYSFVNGLDHGDPCYVELDLCNSTKYLHCGFETNLCECSNTRQTWYDKTTDVCKLLAGVSCSSDINTQQCVTNSVCPHESVIPNPICMCESGFDVNSERRCFKLHDKSCSQQDTVPGVEDPCDPAGFLQVIITNI